jgi:hypothetical protein
MKKHINTFNKINWESYMPINAQKKFNATLWIRSQVNF